jgi:hypothetical protein
MDITQVDIAMPVSEVLRYVASRSGTAIVAYEQSTPAFSFTANDLGPIVVEHGLRDRDIYSFPLRSFLPEGELYVPALRVTSLQGNSDGARPSGTRTYVEAVTDPLRYICEAGHSNPDPDHGRCYRCPMPIVSTQ